MSEHIVRTPGVIGGRPRIDGTRIGVEHVMMYYVAGETAEAIAGDIYDHLTVEQVKAALNWAEDHRCECCGQVIYDPADPPRREEFADDSA